MCGCFTSSALAWVFPAYGTSSSKSSAQSSSGMPLSHVRSRSSTQRIWRLRTWASKKRHGHLRRPRCRVGSTYHQDGKDPMVRRLQEAHPSSLAPRAPHGVSARRTHRVARLRPENPAAMVRHAAGERAVLAVLGSQPLPAGVLVWGRGTRGPSGCVSLGKRLREAVVGADQALGGTGAVLLKEPTGVERCVLQQPADDVDDEPASGCCRRHAGESSDGGETSGRSAGGITWGTNAS